MTDAEVLQELLHRYRAIGRLDAMEAAIGRLAQPRRRGLSPSSGTTSSLRGGCSCGLPRLSARDALHVATMRRHGVDDILTFDSGFDAVGGLRRLPG